MSESWISSVAFLLIIFLVSSTAFVSNKRTLTSTTRFGVSDGYFSIEEIEGYAKFSGLTIKKIVTGPYLRLEAYSSKLDPFGNPMGDETIQVGYLTAFIRPFPFGLFQLDTIQVQNRRQILGFKRKGWTMDGPGISFIMGSYALRWAYENGCKTTELLAVKDSEEMHEILVRLYASFGFTIKRTVGDDSISVADRLVWGAVGTLMEMKIEPFLKIWTPKLRKLIKVASSTTRSDESRDQ